MLGGLLRHPTLTPTSNGFNIRAFVGELHHGIFPLSASPGDSSNHPRASEALSRRRIERGLYTAKQLADLSVALNKLAAWLHKNKPESVREADANFEPTRRFSEQDALCIAYPDHVLPKQGQSPTAALVTLFNEHLADTYNTVHILPHFDSPTIRPELRGPPSRADGGFETCGTTMAPEHGTPRELRQLRARLMFDFVLNHLSTSGEWFQKFLAQDPDYADFFVTIQEEELSKLDMSGVFRPRTHHPVIPFEDPGGRKNYVWCTFSPTQADINVKNPKVLARLLEALVKDFIMEGAQWIRLDAVGFLVKHLGLRHKEPKSPCFSLTETHNIIKALRIFLTEASPATSLVAEVNAGDEVIRTYYGENHDEAHMAYAFPCPPLSLYSIYSEDVTAMLEWARIRSERPQDIGLAFTASHDGVGLLPLDDCSQVQP